MNNLKIAGQIIMVFVSVFLSLVTHAAESVEHSSSLNPVGSGARATGMGGAFIGVADDATAASWNPAGLIQLEKPEISAVYSYFHRKQRYDSEEHPEMDGDNSMDSDGLNYASGAFPFILMERNMIVSLNYQRLYEMNKEIDFMRFVDAGFGDVLARDTSFRQKGYLYTISPAFAVQIIPDLSIGATVNFWDNITGKNGWETSYTTTDNGSFGIMPVQIMSSYNEDVSFKGTNYHFGFLWSINGAFTLGGVYKTPFDADIKRESSTSYSVDMPTIPYHEEQYFMESGDVVLRMPPSYGLGLAYRHSDIWTVSFDVYRTEWSRYVQRDEDESETNPIDGESVHEGRLNDTTQVRMGTEYLFIKGNHVVPLRFGIFYDPEPRTGFLDEYYGMSFGSGYVFKGKAAVDFAYQFRTGRNLTGDVPAVLESDIDVQQHSLMTSAIIYF